MNLDAIAENLDGYSGADITTVCRLVMMIRMVATHLSKGSNLSSRLDLLLCQFSG